MSDVLSRLSKKRGYPIVINGETYYGRPPTIGELKRLDAMEQKIKAGEVQDGLRTGFLIGSTLCVDEKGEQAIHKNQDESDESWAERVIGELSDVPSETIRLFSEGIAALSQSGKSANGT